MKSPQKRWKDLKQNKNLGDYYGNERKMMGNVTEQLQKEILTPMNENMKKVWVMIDEHSKQLQQQSRELEALQKQLKELSF